MLVTSFGAWLCVMVQACVVLCPVARKLVHALVVGETTTGAKRSVRLFFVGLCRAHVLFAGGSAL